MPQPQVAYRFADFKLDLRLQRLYRGDQPVPLQEKPLRVLLALLESSGEVVSRDALKHLLWNSDTYVEFDHGINSAIRRLRSALGDSAESPLFIETLPRKGYRWIVPVEVIASESLGDSAIIGPAPRTRRRFGLVHLAAATILGLLLGLLLARTAPGREQSIRMAVLPFVNLDEASEPLCDLMTRETTTRIGSLNPARLGVVPARWSEEASEVDYFLESSLRLRGDTVFVASQLVDAHTRTQVWGRNYEIGSGRLVRLQSTIAHDIAHALSVRHSTRNLNMGKSPSSSTQSGRREHDHEGKMSRKTSSSSKRGRHSKPSQAKNDAASERRLVSTRP